MPRTGFTEEELRFMGWASISSSVAAVSRKAGMSATQGIDCLGRIKPKLGLRPSASLEDVVAAARQQGIIVA